MNCVARMELANRAFCSGVIFCRSCSRFGGAGVSKGGSGGCRVSVTCFGTAGLDSCSGNISGMGSGLGVGRSMVLIKTLVNCNSICAGDLSTVGVCCVMGTSKMMPCKISAAVSASQKLDCFSVLFWTDVWAGFSMGK